MAEYAPREGVYAACLAVIAGASLCLLHEDDFEALRDGLMPREAPPCVG